MYTKKEKGVTIIKKNYIRREKMLKNKSVHIELYYGLYYIPGPLPTAPLCVVYSVKGLTQLFDKDNILVKQKI